MYLAEGEVVAMPCLCLESCSKYTENKMATTHCIIKHLLVVSAWKPVLVYSYM